MYGTPSYRQLQQARNMGRIAYENGNTMKDSPFHHLTLEHQEFCRGWREAKHDAEMMVE